MSEEDQSGGRRKDGKRYKDGNVRDDGSYVVGAKRPPAHGQFREDDGRKRGSRKAGTRNVDTYFREEADRKVPLTIAGKQHRLPQLQVTMKTLFENANVRKQTQAIALLLDQARRMTEKDEARETGPALSDPAIIANLMSEYHDSLLNAGTVSDDANSPAAQGGTTDDPTP